MHGVPLAPLVVSHLSDFLTAHLVEAAVQKHVSLVVIPCSAATRLLQATVVVLFLVFAAAPPRGRLQG